MVVKPFILRGITKIGNRIISHCPVFITVNKKSKKITSNDNGEFLEDITSMTNRTITEKDKIHVEIRVKMRVDLNMSQRTINEGAIYIEYN